MVAGTELIAVMRHILVVYSVPVSLCHVSQVCCAYVFLLLKLAVSGLRILPCKSLFSSFPKCASTQSSLTIPLKSIQEPDSEHGTSEARGHPGHRFTLADGHHKGQSIGPSIDW